MFQATHSIAPVVAALILHEGGHVVATLARGLKVKGLVVSWMGIGVRRERGTDLDTAIIAAAGPLANLAAALLFQHSDGVFFANIALAVGNLLPLPGSDGMKIIAYCSCLMQAGRTRV